MKEIPDSFLLALSEVLATLIGFLLIAMFFFIERKSDEEFVGLRETGFGYLRAAVRMTLLLYSVALAIVLGLVVLDRMWSIVLFGLISLAVVVSAVDVTRRQRALAKVARIRGASPILMWAILAVILIPPWVVGQMAPGRTELTVAAVLAGAFAFMNTVGFLLSTFDLEHLTVARGKSNLERSGDGPTHRLGRLGRDRGGT